MAFYESLAARIRDALARKKGVEEQKMFGGISFLLNGNLLVGVWKDSLCVRFGPDQAEEALKEPHVSELDITGRPMNGWVLVDPEGVEGDDQLARWVGRSAVPQVLLVLFRSPLFILKGLVQSCPHSAKDSVDLVRLGNNGADLLVQGVCQECFVFGVQSSILESSL
jgi:hypothetical protein